MTKEKLKKIFVVLSILVICLVGLSIFRKSVFVYANDTGTGIEIDTETDDKDKKLVLHFLQPTLILQLNRYGLLPLLGYVAIIFTGYFVLVILITIVKTAMQFVSDESAEMKDAMKSSLEIYQAIGYTTSFLILYALISIFLGVGNMFKWPSKLAQCNGEILFRAEYRAEVFNSDLMRKEHLTYCCKSFGSNAGFDMTKSSEQNMENRIRTESEIGYDGVGVGKTTGGWLFIGNLQGENRPFSEPPEITEPEGCVYYPD